MKLKLVISYDGSQFNGWQKQKSGPPTVQGTLEEIFERLFSQKIQVVGSGRTDAGVHAVSQVAHCVVPRVPSQLLRSLNALAPESLVIKSLWEAPEDFHALASAEKKTYIYRIWNNRRRSVFLRNWTHHVEKPIDLKYLQAISETLLGHHNFKSFQSRGTPVATTVRTLFQAQWSELRPGVLEFRIQGDGFLKQMVRNIVGTLLYMERKKLDPRTLRDILGAKDRQAAKDTAPPQGLYLFRVEYPSDLDNRCRKL